MAADDRRIHGDLTLEDDFPTPSVEEWRAAVESSLRNRSLDDLVAPTLEGIPIEPLYTADNLPIARGVRRGIVGWQACQRLAHPDPVVAGRWAAEEPGRGVDGLWLAMGGAARRGLDPDHRRAAAFFGDGIEFSIATDLDPLLAHIDLGNTFVSLDAGGNGFAAAALVVAAAARHGHSPADLSAAFDFDPLGALAADGEPVCADRRTKELLCDLVAWTEREAPTARAIAVSSLPYASAGATAIQELAFLLATGVEYLRMLAARDVDPIAADRRLRFVTSIGRDLSMEIAKLRALRRLWSRVIAACGGATDGSTAPIHAVTSIRTLTRRDPWVNILRSTGAAFAAAVGGADVVTVLPFDGVDRLPGALGRRIAATTHAVLREESHLDRVADPAGGSFMVERLSDELAEAAWSRFQEIEGDGGMRRALVYGAVHEELEQAATVRRAAVARLVDPITGVSSFADLSEKELEEEPIDLDSLRAAASERLEAHRRRHDLTAELARLADAAAAGRGDGAVTAAAVEAFRGGATLGQVAETLRGTEEPPTIEPMRRDRDSRPFELLRDAADVFYLNTGRRPSVYLAAVGSAAEHRTASDLLRNVLAAGGIETIATGPCSTVEDGAAAFIDSGAGAAAISVAANRAANVVPQLARALRSEGAREVIYVGRPGESEAALRDAGVGEFVSAGVDVVDLLSSLQQSLGVVDD